MTQEYQNVVRTLGGLPPRTECSSKIVECVDLPKYYREKVILAAGERTIPLYLFVPKGENARPAILAYHQHNLEYHLGKSEPAGLSGNFDLAYALRLAERGYVVATWDFIGFEERNDASFGSSHEQYLGTKAIVEGACLQREYVQDAMYVTDYLVSRPEVKTDSVGAIGHSLGGQSVLFSLLLDERITVGVSSCGIGTVRSFLEERIQHNLAWYIPGLLKLGDTPGLAPLLAGKSLFISQGTRDSLFPLRGVQQFTETAANFAEVELHLFDGGHLFPREVQEAAFNFLDRKLKPNEIGVRAT